MSDIRSIAPGPAVILALNLVLVLETFGVAIPRPRRLKSPAAGTSYTSSTSTTPGMARMADALRGEIW